MHNNQISTGCQQKNPVCEEGREKILLCFRGFRMLFYKEFRNKIKIAVLYAAIIKIGNILRNGSDYMFPC